MLRKAGLSNMPQIYSIRPLLYFVLSSWWLVTGAASSSPALLKAKQEAEARGYLFETSRDDIVAKAKNEGKLRVLASSAPETVAPLVKAFRDKYPFIDAHAQEITREDSQTRATQLKARVELGEDVVLVPPDLFRE